MDREQFKSDVTDAKKLLEDITGEEIIGYRSPSFSATDQTPWFYETLSEAGYKYDSSLFPAKRAEGGMSSNRIYPHIIDTGSGNILEFPISVTPILGKNFCFFGGGFLRLFPGKVIKNRANYLKQRGIPPLYYIHPREIEPHHPRLALPPLKYFKTYVNLKTVRPKLDMILTTGRFMTLKDYYHQSMINGAFRHDR
jgi:polysaccharide deacetylase family protein (PEP-CTERM system associated)